MKITWLGLQDYSRIQTFQKEKVHEFVGHPGIHIFGLEFDSTLTLGLRFHRNKNSNAALNSVFKVVQTDRGGQATLHSKGQLVIFPMIDLKYYKVGIQQFIEILFQSTQLFLNQYKVPSTWNLTEAGVYTSRGKIAFCGLKIQSGVVRHGISINICNDLNLFKDFVPCGNPTLSTDSLVKHLSVSQQQEPLDTYFHSWCLCFSKIWEQFALNNKAEPLEIVGNDFFLNSSLSPDI